LVVNRSKEDLVEYMLLIYNAGDREQASQEERDAMFAEFGKYTQEAQEAGVLVAGDPLQGPDSATTVRGRGAETVTSDGPFAETKEWLGGYYKMELQSIDDAIEWASRIPIVKYGGAVEVRPVLPVPAGSPSRS
jgi:hypothetical protein